MQQNAKNAENTFLLKAQPYFPPLGKILPKAYSLFVMQHLCIRQRSARFGHAIAFFPPQKDTK